MKKGGIIIGTIIALIITVIFVVMFANIVGNFFSGIPTVRGAIADPTKVVCFEEHRTVHCLEKETGEEVFYFEAAKSWKKGDSSLGAPLLTETGLYFGILNWFCAYTEEGQNKWEDCIKYDNRIASGIDADDTYVCFGDGNGHQYHCHGTSTGTWAADSKKLGKAIYSPLIDGDNVYFAFKKGTKTTTIYKDEPKSVFEKNIKVEAVHQSSTDISVDGGEIKKLSGSSYEDFGDIEIKLDDQQEKVKAKITVKLKKGRIQKYDLKADRSISEDKINVNTKLVSSEKYICYGILNNDRAKLICEDKNTEAIVIDYTEVGKDVAAPAIEQYTNTIYAGLGKYFYKFQPSAMNSPVWGDKQENDISTNIAVGEGVACFGEGHTIRCFNIRLAVPSEIFNVTAPTTWDFRDAETTPIILDGVVYFGLGDRVCAYSTTTEGNFIGEEGAIWCVNFERKVLPIITGIESGELAVVG